MPDGNFHVAFRTTYIRSEALPALFFKFDRSRLFSLATEKNIKYIPGMAGEDFRTFLNTELNRRLSNNPRYSLRAFARDLNVEPSLLSKILRKKVSLTPVMFERFCKQLRLPSELQETLKRVTFGDPLTKYNPDEQNIDYLSVEEFLLISDWYHYAILEMVSTKDFVPKAQYIAKRLNISLVLADQAVKRLFTLGLLTKTQHGWQTSSRFTSTLKQETSSQALRTRQVQILQKAAIALDEVHHDFRDNSAVTLSLDPAILPEVKQKIMQFRRSLATFIEERSGAKKSEVYELAIAFFPMTTQEKES